MIGSELICDTCVTRERTFNHVSQMSSLSIRHSRCSNYSNNPMVECGTCKTLFCSDCSKGAGTTCQRLLFEELEGEELCLHFTCRACALSLKRCAEGVCKCLESCRVCVFECVRQTRTYSISRARERARTHTHTPCKSTHIHTHIPTPTHSQLQEADVCGVRYKHRVLGLLSARLP